MLGNLFGRSKKKEESKAGKEGTITTLFSDYTYKYIYGPENMPVTVLTPIKADNPFAYAANVLSGWPPEESLQICIDGFLQGYMHGVRDHYQACDANNHLLDPNEFQTLFARRIISKVSGEE